MEPSIPAPVNPGPGCPRCGGAADSPYWQGGVCLRCAGERLFAPESDGVVPHPSSASPSARSGPSGDDSMPATLGPYELIEELGRGGMGRVYAARQIGLGRIVALKVMSDACHAADFELRFLREAQTAARLRHPNLVAVHDFGRAGGRIYFSMDYVEGGDLAQRLRGRPFAPWESATLLRKVALALAYAHGEGVLHRDLKPSNILLDGDEPKLADFGLAAPMEPGGDLTLVTGVLGTPHYLAPEALRQGSAALTVASDLFALGTILFELLTGRTPYAGATAGALPGLLEAGEPPSPRLLAPAVPADLETICLKCLEREPARRYPDAAALAEDLRRFLDGEPILARPISGPARFVRWCRRRPALAAVWVLVVALAAGSTVAAGVIQRMLVRARTAEAASRERLREARLAEASAVRRTTEPGRRERALAALTEAARIRPGIDVRNEMINALLVPDLRKVESWDISEGRPSSISLDPAGHHALAIPIEYDGPKSPVGVLRTLDGSREPVALRNPGTNTVGEFRFSMDGTLLAGRYLDSTLRVWRAGEKEAFLVLGDRPNPGGAYRTSYFNDDFDFGPDGGLLALGLPGGGLSLHRLPAGVEMARTTMGGVFHRIRVAPDGRHVAASIAADSRERVLWIFDVPSLALSRRFELESEPCAVAWSGDGDRIAVALANNTVEIRSVSGGGLVNAFPSPVRSPADIGFLAGGRLLGVRGGPATLFLVSPVTGREELRILDYGVAPLAAGLSQTRVMSGGVDGLVTHWESEPATGYRTIPPPRPGGREQSFANACLDFSPDGLLEASAHGRFAMLREVGTGRLLCEYDDQDAHGIEFTSLAFSADGRSLLRSSGFTGLSRLPIRRTSEGLTEIGPAETLDPDADFVMTDRSADRRRLVLVSAQSGLVKVVELAGTGIRELRRWEVTGAYSAAFSPEADRLLVNCVGGGPMKMRVCRVSDGSTVAEPDGEAFGEAVWSGDGTVAMTTNGQQESRVWDASTWKLRARITGRAGGNITSFQLSPDGSYAVSVRDGTVHLLWTRDGSEFATFQPPNSPGMASAVRFLPDGRRFGILWRDSQLDIVDPEAIRAQLETHGLGWPAAGK